MKLTQRTITTLAPGRYSDPQCKTLQLLVTKTGGRSWVQRLHVDGRRLDRGLGGVEFTTLAEAREIAARNRFAARRGGQPFADQDAARKATTAPTFADACRSLLEANRATWAPTSVKTYNSTVNHLMPRLGDRPVAAIKRADVIDALKRIDSQSARTKALKRTRQILDHAVVREWTPVNVADNGGLDQAVGIRPQGPSHHRAAPHADCPGILRRLLAAGTAAADALAFIMLTASRLTEATGAAWCEIDLDAAMWTVPASRMKAKREHRVPLSDAALAILRRRAGQHDGLVFGDRAGRVPTQNAVAKLAAPHTTHGARTSFRTWVDDTNRDGEAAEHALAHVTGNSVSRCYARSDLFDRRRELMDAWGAYLAE